MDEQTHEPLLPILTLIVDTANKLRKDGHRVVIVSSGAIGVGLRRMDVDKRPKHLAQLQVSVPSPIHCLGPALTMPWNPGPRSDRPMSSHEFVGQPLRASGATNRPDSSDTQRHCRCKTSRQLSSCLAISRRVANEALQRTRYLNAQNTFNQLLEMGVIPIVNETTLWPSPKSNLVTTIPFRQSRRQ